MNKITHHPGEDLLFDYATGGLGEGWGLAVATHLAICPTCRNSVSQMEAIGGSFLDDISPQQLDETAFDQLINHIEQQPDQFEVTTRPQNVLADPPLLPEPLRSYVGGDVDQLPWKRLGFGASQLLVPLGEDGVTARLLCIPAGQPVPTHSHGGLELTLVMSGAFSDDTGHYGRGDLQEADHQLEHQPRADADADCICLAITDAPLRFRSLAARVVQPFLGI